MKNMQCPKCQSREIVRLPGDIQPPSTLGEAKSASSLKTIRTTLYCCANCGFSEVWVDDPEDLKNLLKRFGF